MHIEEIDHRSHQESSNNGADTHEAENCRKSAASGKEGSDTYRDTDKVADDTAGAEFGNSPFMCSDQRERVIGGYAQVRGEI